MTTNYFLVGALAVMIGILGFRFHQYVLERNFVVLASVSCDPATESCFVADCSPDDDPECDLTPYKKVEVISAEAPGCLEEHTCEAFACTTESCSITECSDDSLEEGEVCFVAEADEADESGDSADTEDAEQPAEEELEPGSIETPTMPQ